MLTAVGALLILCSCFALSIKLIERSHRALQAVHDFSELLKELANAISFRLEPLPQIIKRMSTEEDAPVLTFLQYLDRELSSDEHCPLHIPWQAALEAFQKEYRLPERAYKLLQSLGPQLGTMDFETETSRLKNMGHELFSLYKDTETGFYKNKKLTESLGILTGIAIVILFL